MSQIPGGKSAPPPAHADTACYPRPAYAWYVLGVLTLVYVFSFIDRTILNLLVAPIRRDMQISDTQMSLLIGIAFAAFYVGFGIPIGRLADSVSRRALIAGGFALWSLFTAGCGLISNYSQLALMRMGVGVGEAALSPAAYSMITDYFPPNRRGTAQGIYNAAIYIGSGLALVVGGMVTGWSANHPNLELPLLGNVRSWQVVFLVIGLAGLVVVPIMLTVKEPHRQGAAAGEKSIPLGEVLRYFKKHWQAYTCHNVGIALLSFSGYGSAAWVPTFFIRQHHWTAQQIGLVYGVISAVFGALGLCAAGWLADRMCARGRRDACMYIGFLVAILWFPTGAGFLLVADPTLAIVLTAPTQFLASAVFSIGPMALMQITPQRMRGQAGAIYLFVINLIGLGLGPTAVAICTDYLFHDDNMVGYSILIVTVVAHLIAGLLLWYGRKPFVKTQDELALTMAEQAA